MSMMLFLSRQVRASGPTPPDNPGDPFEGGFYVGQIIVGSNLYALVISPKTAQFTNRAFKTTDTATAGTESWNDGWANTQAMNNAAHPAAQFCRTLTTGGFNDWYIPSADESEMIYRYLKATTTANSLGPRGGTPLGYAGENASSYPLGDLYTAGIPAQTTVAAFMTGGAQSYEGSPFFATSTCDVLGPTQPFVLNHFGTNGAVSQNTVKTTTTWVYRPVRRVLLGPAPASQLSLGMAIWGGYYVGDMQYSATRRAHIIITPKAAEVERAWKTATTIDTGALSLFDGWANNLGLITATYPAIQYSRTLATSGRGDWYLGARDEIELLYRYLKPGTATNWTTARTASEGGGANGSNTNSIPNGAGYTTTDPAQTSVALFQLGGAQAIGADSDTQNVWTSTNNQIGDANGALCQLFPTFGTSGGWQVSRTKTLPSLVRPIRRLPY